MLALTRRVGEEIVFGDPNNPTGTIRVMEVQGDKVRLGFEFPRDVKINRRELADLKAAGPITPEERCERMQASLQEMDVPCLVSMKGDGSSVWVNTPQADAFPAAGGWFLRIRGTGKSTAEGRLIGTDQDARAFLAELHKCAETKETT